MGKKTKIWLILAAAMMFSGLVMYFVFVGNVTMKTNTHVVKGYFQSVIIDSDVANVAVLPSTDGTCRVVCYEREIAIHNVFTYDNTLWIKAVDNRSLLEHLLIGFERPQITVYIPQEEYSWLCIKGETGDVEVGEGLNFGTVEVSRSTGDVKCIGTASYTMQINTTTGDISVQNVLTEELELSVTTGDITLSDIICVKAVVNINTGDVHAQGINCQNLVSDGSTGDICLNDVIAENKILIDRSTGDVFLGSSDAAEIVINTTTGDVEGVLRTDKVFVVTTNTGIVDVPKSITGGKCEINTTTGNIRFIIFAPL